MIKSINQWSFPAGMTAIECVTQAKAAGYEGFEPALNEHGFLSLDEHAVSAKELKKHAEREGVRLVSLASGLYWTYPLTSGNAEIRGNAKAILRLQIDCARELGVDAILVVPGVVGRGFWGGEECTSYEDAYCRAVESLREAAPYAEENGIVIGIENVWNNFLLSPLEMARFIDEIGSSYVRAYLDVGNVVQYGQSEQWVRILAHRIARVHIKDFKKSVGTLDGFCDLLEGDVDFPAVMAALRAAGYDGALTLEKGVYRHYPMASVLQASRAMDIIMGRVKI